jgi:hypothetical protein
MEPLSLDALPPDGQDDADDDARHRCTAAELLERQAFALELLEQDYGTSMAAKRAAAEFGVSLRQAQRYVRLALTEFVGELNTAALDLEQGWHLAQLERQIQRAIEADDSVEIVRAIKARAQIINQFRKAIQPVGRQRITLRNSRTRPEMPF